MMIALYDKLSKNLFKLSSYFLENVFLFESIKLVCIIYFVFIIAEYKQSILRRIISNSVGYPKVLTIWLILRSIFLILVREFHLVSMFFCFLYKRILIKFIKSKNRTFSKSCLNFLCWSLFILIFQKYTRISISFKQLKILSENKMATRLKEMAEKFVSEPLNYMDYQSLFPKEERTIYEKINKWCKKYVDTQEMDECYDKAEFPEFLLKPLQQLNIAQYFVGKQHGGNSLSTLGQGMILATIASYDASVSLFVLLQAPLCGKTIEKLATEEQKNQYLPDLLSFRKIWGWALTQEKVGSNAAQIQSNVQTNKGGYVLNGNKRWIGNGNGDYLIVYAKNLQTKKVQGFFVDMKTPGIKKHKIENKLGMRCVQNYQIYFRNVQLSKHSLLPDAKSFRKGVEIMLKSSRINVIFITFGVCLGVYRNTVQYVSKREQFGVPVSSFQIMQMKLVDIMANLQAMALVCERIAHMSDNGELTTGIVSMFKAWTTERARRICRLGREALGGNGITHDRYVMKALTDVEALYTLEGTYEMNTLVAGRELTGLSAIKKR